jgi:hypothetical protein
MNYITIDDEFYYHLRGILEPVELRGSNGEVLGTFTPLVTPELRALYEKAKKSFDPAEMERRAQEAKSGKGIPLAEFWRRLHASEDAR